MARMEAGQIEDCLHCYIRRFRDGYLWRISSLEKFTSRDLNSEIPDLTCGKNVDKFFVCASC